MHVLKDPHPVRRFPQLQYATRKQKVKRADSDSSKNMQGVYESLKKRHMYFDHLCLHLVYGSA